MTIHLPNHLEGQVREAVRSGRFPSIDEAMAEAARLLIVEMNRTSAAPASAAGPASDPILGLMRDAADDMDEIVADAYRRRSEETWREIDL